MGKIRNFVKKLRSVSREEHDNAILEILKKHERFIVNLNKQQLIKGQDSEGNSLGEYKNEFYAKFKLTLNPRGVVDLRLNGLFWDSFYLDADKFPIFIDATDEKRDELVKKYGKTLFGIDSESLQILHNAIRQDIQKYFKTFFKK